MANQQGGGDYGHVFSFGISPHNNLNIPPHPPPVVYNNNPISTPPLSAIDRFLASDHEINTTPASQNNNMWTFDQNYLEVPYDSHNFFYENRHYSGPNNNLSRHSDHVSNNQHQSTNYGIFMTESQIRNWEKSVGDVIDGHEEMRRRTSNQKKRSRVRGTGKSSNIIKGQWTADEDRYKLLYINKFSLIIYKHILLDPPNYILKLFKFFFFFSF